MSLEIPTTPAKLAMPIAETRFIDSSFECGVRDRSDLVELDMMADSAGLIGGGWFVEASRGFVTPASFEAHEDIKYHVLNSLYFEGNFSCYSRVSIGRLVGNGAVRALCLTFGAGMLVSPTFSELDKADLLHVPVFAVTDMSRS